MSPTQSKSQWDRLFSEACHLIDHVNQDGPIIDHWTFGGGTALMLQIQQRESHDVDLFIDDPQYLGLIRQVLGSSNFNFQIGTPTYDGDGVQHLRLEFEGIGEIDFIVAAELTDNPTLNYEVQGRMTRLETPAEIVCKKVRYRGHAIQPRDIYDIAASVESGYSESIAEGLSGIPDAKERAKARLDKLGEEYVTSNIGKLLMRPKFKHLQTDALPMVRSFFASL